VAASFRPDKIYSLQHNQDIYNSSKICLSVSHAQAIEGFPWRIMDILASNGCLLTDRKKGIADFTKGFVDIPTFDSPIEARDLAAKLLKDEKWRRDIVLGSQACIAAKGRWHHRYAAIEETTGVKLSSVAGVGSISCIYGEDYIVPVRETVRDVLHRSFVMRAKDQLRTYPSLMRVARKVRSVLT
jgi:Glycosyl transferases group 1